MNSIGVRNEGERLEIFKKTDTFNSLERMRGRGAFGRLHS